ADADALVLDHALQVDVHHQVLGGVHLHVLDDRILGALADLQSHDGRVEALIGDHGQQVLLVEDQRLGGLVGAVQGGRDLAHVTQAAARTLAMRFAEVRAESEGNTHYSLQIVTEHCRSATRAASKKTLTNRRTANSPIPRRGCAGWSRPAAPPPTAAGC